METSGFQWNLSRNFTHCGAGHAVWGMWGRYSLCYGMQQMISRRYTSSHPHWAFSAGLSTGSSESLQTPVGIYLGFPPALWQSMKISAAWLAASLTLHIFFFPRCSTPICQNPHGGLWQKLLFWRGRTVGNEADPAACPLLSRPSLHLSDVKKSSLRSLLMGRVTWKMLRVLFELPLRLY